jgi:catechol 2,3-dioxygenase-like lactoylglutathione lyase family enzyme
MGALNGVHHIALMTANIKEQIEFFTDVLGMELKALYWMHGVDGFFHAFLNLDDSSSVAFVQKHGADPIPTEMGKTHAGNPVTDCAPGTMQHIAFNIDNDEELYAMRDRIRSRGVPVMGPIDHGFCKSMYFGGPENLVLEVSTSYAGINEEQWIDPEVAKLVGMSDDEVARYKAPKRYVNDTGTAIPQPPLDAGKPMYTNMNDEFAGTFSLPDDVVYEEISHTEPPVKIASAG